jgi:hypothetical protein
MERLLGELDAAIAEFESVADSDDFGIVWNAVARVQDAAGALIELQTVPVLLRDSTRRTLMVALAAINNAIVVFAQACQSYQTGEGEWVLEVVDEELLSLAFSHLSQSVENYQNFYRFAPPS